MGAVSIASAVEVHLVGSTKGHFDTQAFWLQHPLNLSYNGSTIDHMTVRNLLDFGGDPIPSANLNNLASLTNGNADATFTYNGLS